MLDALPLILGGFTYSSSEWPPVEKELSGVGIDPVAARPLIEEAVTLWQLAHTTQDAKHENKTVRRKIDRFKQAAEDVAILLPATARKSLDRIVAALEQLEKEDAAAAIGASRRKSLAEELIWTWRYNLGGDVQRSRNPIDNTPGGPLVRFLVAATAPIQAEALNPDQAAYRIEKCKAAIAAGEWPA